MYTRSLIQQNLEILKAKENFNEGVSSLMEKYNIEDSIFVISNGSVKELTKGYFVIEKEYDNINEAIRNCNINTQGVRVVENNKFMVGSIFSHLSQCPENSNILDVELYEDVR